ncbi:MAG TPA: hypothetical protein VF334_21395, partial [Polyangia bacterium]
MKRASLLALALVFAIGCEEKKETPQAPAPAPAAPTTGAAPASGAAAAPASGAATLPADRGEVTGTVVVTGKIPVMEDLKRNSDA